MDREKEPEETAWHIFRKGPYHISIAIVDGKAAAFPGTC